MALDHLVGAGEQRRWHFKAEGLRGLEIDHQLELGGLQYRQIDWPGPFENPRRVDANLAVGVDGVYCIAHQAASGSIFTELIDRRRRIARCQDHKLTTAVCFPRPGVTVL